MNIIQKLVALSAATIGSVLIAATPASAVTLIYSVSDYTGGGHGLWTNRLDSGANRFYSFQPGALFTIDTTAGTGTFVGTAINPVSEIATINLSLGGFLETTDGTAFQYKREGGAAYNPLTDTPDIDFFSTMTGTMTIDGTAYAIDNPPFVGNHLFQYGTGANAKRANDFGGSSWVQLDGVPHHVDLNFNLTAVPEPATWAMMILGFGMVGGALRTRRKFDKPERSASFA